jgi:hypothetical protein
LGYHQSLSLQMPKIYLVVLIVLVTSESSLLIDNEKENCLKGIFNIDEDVTFATSTTFQNDDFIFEISNPKLIRNYKGGEQLSSKNDRNYNYVIEDGDYVDFKNTISNLLKENNLKVNGKYLIKMKSNLEEFEMRLFLSLLWKYEVYNVVIERNHQFYTWYPYERWGEMTVRRTNLTQAFANKIPKKLDCTWKVDWSPSSIIVKNAHNDTDPGIFILYMNEIAKRMGVSLQYSKTDDGLMSKLKRIRPFDLGQAMDEGNFTVAVGGFSYFFGLMNLTTTEQTTYIAPLEEFMIIPPRRTKPRWREFFRFDTTSAILFTATVLGCGVLICLVAKLPPVQSLLLSFQMFIQLTISLTPKRLSSKVFFCFLLVSSMLINSLYQSTLSGVFTEPSYESKITSFDDFATTDIPFECPEGFCSTLLSLFTPNTKSLIEKKTKGSKRSSLNEILYFLNRSDHAFLSSSFHLNFVKNVAALGKIRVLSPPNSTILN